MGSEYFINSQELEDKIRQLLPSQGGAGAGFDLSASTQIIPIIDLTESAEGSNLRQDLQKSLSHTSSNHTLIENATTTLVSNTGYYLVNIGYIIKQEATNTRTATLRINDGATNKIVWQMSLHESSEVYSASGTQSIIVFLTAGDSLVGVSSAVQVMLNVVTRQIATIDGILVNPT
jgi:hypothetical protein